MSATATPGCVSMRVGLCVLSSSKVFKYHQQTIAEESKCESIELFAFVVVYNQGDYRVCMHVCALIIKDTISRQSLKRTNARRLSFLLLLLYTFSSPSLIHFRRELSGSWGNNDKNKKNQKK